MARVEFSVDSVEMEKIVHRLLAMERLPSVASKALTLGANLVLETARANAPVRTGKLQKALRVGRIRRYSIEVGTFHGEAPHAHLVELGHGGPKPAGPHPFLVPAFENNEDKIVNAIMDELKKVIL